MWCDSPQLFFSADAPKRASFGVKAALGMPCLELVNILENSYWVRGSDSEYCSGVPCQTKNRLVVLAFASDDFVITK